LGTQFFFICNLLKISFQNHYSLEFMHIKVWRTDRQAENLYI
jgi:hypothetical protein